MSGEYSVTAEGTKDYSYSYFQAAIGKCICERLVTLEDPLTNTCDCGREYNMSAQLLAPRSQWEEKWYADEW